MKKITFIYLTVLFTGSWVITGRAANHVVAETVPGAAFTQLTVTINAVAVKCYGGNNGSATAIASGTPPYTYSWNSNPVQNTATATGLVAGNYTVTVTDAAGKTGNAAISIAQPAAKLSVSIGKTDANCNTADGTATVSVNGGTGVYSYLWSNNQTTASIALLPVDHYSVTVTDANGCTAAGSIHINNKNAPEIAVTATHVTGCFGGSNGSATVTASGGSGTLTYSWNTTPAKSTPSITGLSAGTYMVTVMDTSNCIAKSAVTIMQPAVISVTANPVNLSSCTANDGRITTTVSGGVGPYTYLWSNNKTTSTITGLAKGTYSLTVTDANKCTKPTTATVNCTAITLNIAASAVNVKCYGSKDGSATVTVTTGTAPYTYSWSTMPVQTNATATRLAAGTYTVTVKDANGTKTATVNIVNPPALTTTMTVTDASSCSRNDGSITARVSGGTLPYSFMWSNEKTTSIITALAAGTYSLTVTDANSCSKSTPATVHCASGTLAVPVNPLDAFLIYPNPASTSFTITGSHNGERINYTVCNIVGMEVKAGNMAINNGSFNETIQAAGFPKGMFFVTLSDRNNRWVKKINIR